MIRFIKNSFIVIFLLIQLQCINAQVVNAKSEDFKEITTRPLIVQLVSEDSYLVEDLEKRISKTSNAKRKTEIEAELNAYREFISSYNLLIKDVVKKIWQLNKEKTIEFKTFSETQDIRRVNARNYSLLQFVQTKLWVTNDYGKETFTTKTIPTLVYSRMEKAEPYDDNFNKKIDYSIYLPFINSRSNQQLLESDLIIILKIMQNHIEEIQTYDKKNYTAFDFAKDQDEEFCDQLKGLTLLLDEKLLDKKTNKQDIGKAFTGNLSVISTDEISKSINQAEDVPVSIVLPYSIKHDKSGIPGLESSELIMYIKCFINAKTANFYSCYGTKAVDNWEPFFKTQEFKKIEKCK
jgi:hypothetical protein